MEGRDSQGQEQLRELCGGRNKQNLMKREQRRDAVGLGQHARDTKNLM